MIKLDARGKSCPLPVIEAKKALETPNGANGLIILVDNEIAVQNLIKLAKTLHYKTNVTQPDPSIYQVAFSSLGIVSSTDETAVAPPSTVGDAVVLICSDTFGNGDDDLGTALMKGFLYSLTETDQLPNTVIFCNSGVKLALESHVALGSLMELEERGTKILSCGACLDFYQCTDQLAVGSITNMYTIANILTTHSHIIRI